MLKDIEKNAKMWKDIERNAKLNEFLLPLGPIWRGFTFLTQRYEKRCLFGIKQEIGMKMLRFSHWLTTNHWPLKERRITTLTRPPRRGTKLWPAELRWESDKNRRIAIIAWSRARSMDNNYNIRMSCYQLCQARDVRGVSQTPYCQTISNVGPYKWL